MDYEKYSDRALLAKPLAEMSPEERDLYDVLVQRKAKELMGNFSSGRERDAIATAVAEQILKEKERQNDDA